METTDTVQEMSNSASAEIRVRGEAEARCLPDRAVLTIEVEAEAEFRSFRPGC